MLPNCLPSTTRSVRLPLTSENKYLGAKLTLDTLEEAVRAQDDVELNRVLSNSRVAGTSKITPPEGSCHVEVSLNSIQYRDLNHIPLGDPNLVLVNVTYRVLLMLMIGRGSVAHPLHCHSTAPVASDPS